MNSVHRQARAAARAGISGLAALCAFGCAEPKPEPDPEISKTIDIPSQAALAPLFGEDTPEGSVVVSFSFDDGFASQATFFEILEEHKLDSIKATFFLNSSRLNLEINERESRDDVKYAPLDLWLKAAEQGHEIGSHSVSHLDLSCTEERAAEDLCQPGHDPISDEERRRQICSDVEQLKALGFQITGFAYPFGRDELGDGETLHEMVARCGVDYARDTSGLRRGLSADGDEPIAESVPPYNPYAIRSYDSLTSDVHADDLRRWVLDAIDQGGGWVPLVFHHVSDDCADPEDPEQQLGVCVLRDELEEFVLWLAGVDEGVDEDDAAPELVHVRTLGQVMAELGHPILLLVANGGLEEAHSGSIERPNCFDRSEGKHEVNYEWSSAELEQQRREDGEYGDPDGANGHFEKLIPSESHPTPISHMTTRDDRCYLPADPKGRYQVRLRAKARSSDDAPVEGRFVFQILRALETDGGVDPVWSDWKLDVPVQELTQNWETYSLSLPQLPKDSVALAFGYQYVGPEASEDEHHEVWIDDFSISAYMPY